MAAIDQSRLSLRIFGDSLDPDVVSNQLGKQPTFSSRKGEIARRHEGACEYIAKSNSWLLNAEHRSPGDLDGQITEIFNGLTDDLSVWNSLCSQFEVDLFCGLFMKEGNEGIGLSARSMRLIGERGVSLNFDIYGPD
jgi:hypothetical protein